MNSTPESNKPKSTAKKIRIAALSALSIIFLAFIIFIRSYVIPTPAMEGSLLVGDHIFVNEQHYEFSKVNQGDVVVFKVPAKALNNGMDLPISAKTTYIKRCIGLPGNMLLVKNKQVYTNGILLSDPTEVEYSYVITTREEITNRNLLKFGLGAEDFNIIGRSENGSIQYMMFLTTEQATKLKQLDFVTSIEQEGGDDDSNVFPYSFYYDGNEQEQNKYYHWSADNFGPLWIPNAGASININDSTLALYGTIIRLYDQNKDVKIKAGKLFIDGKKVSKYTFKQNYYFMMGDNRHNSLDSRYWGFVPEDHISGKALIVFYSFNKETNGLRWDRFFKSIN
jgi:signal peptidase I